MEKHQRFEIGQAVTRNCNKRWVHMRDNCDGPHPRFGEIVHVHKYHEYAYGQWYIEICEYHTGVVSYSEPSFSPVITDKQLQEAINEIEVTV